MVIRKSSIIFLNNSFINHVFINSLLNNHEWALIELRQKYLIEHIGSFVPPRCRFQCCFGEDSNMLLQIMINHEENKKELSNKEFTYLIENHIIIMWEVLKKFKE